MGNKDCIEMLSFNTAKLDLLVDCWVLADYIGAYAFANLTMDELINTYGEIYAATEQQIPLYNLSYI